MQKLLELDISRIEENFGLAITLLQSAELSSSSDVNHRESLNVRNRMFFILVTSHALMLSDKKKPANLHALLDVKLLLRQIHAIFSASFPLVTCKFATSEGSPY